MKLALLFGIIFISIFILKVDAAVARSESNAGEKATPFKAGGNKRSGPKKMVRVPITSVPISPQLIEIDKRLSMDGVKKELTEKQAKWIERFVTSTKNWLYLIDNILKTQKFRDLYMKHLQSEFDMWITGRKEEAFDMIYRNENDPSEPPAHYKLIIYRISLANIGLVQNLNLKSLEIGFERSKTKMRTPKGEEVYRKDRFFILEIEAEFPILDVKFRHEIVRGKEQGEFDPNKSEDKQDVKPGYLRMRLTTVKIYIKSYIVEIDKRFIQEDPVTKETYYFRKPEILDLKFSVGEAELFEPTFQKKPNLSEDMVGPGIPKSRADKILKDFAHFLVLNRDEKELNDRLKVALMNRYSRPMMLSSDVALFVINLDEETAFYSPHLPIKVDDEEELEMAYKLFYMSYSLKSFVSACKSYFFQALEYQSQVDFNDKDPANKHLTPEEREEKLKKEAEAADKLEELGNKAEQWLDEQIKKATINGIPVLDDGFDWKEKME